MNLGAWTWWQIALAIAAYWLLLITCWVLYRSHPTRQAQARAAAGLEIIPSKAPGEETHVYSANINVLRLAVWLFVPPVLLVLAWMTL